MESIVKSESGEQLNVLYQTKNQFYAFYEKSFLVLPDSRTIVGLDAETGSTLVTEDIITNKSTTFGIHENFIYTLLYDKMTKSLFADDGRGYVIQYKKRSKNHPFCLVKNYGYLGIGSILSCAQVGGFAFFGGENYSIVAINIRERGLCEGFLKSPFWDSFSLQVCHGLDQKVYLSILGNDRSYSSDVFDFLDVTEVYKKQCTETSQDFPEANENLNISHSKNAMIESFILESEQIDPYLPHAKTPSTVTRNKNKYKKRLIQT